MKTSGYFPKQWEIEVNELDLSFFEQDIKSPAVDDFAARMSLMKGLVFSNHRQRVSLLRHAKKLKIDLSNYLSKNK